MRVLFASDHAGVELKAALVAECRKWNHEVTDLGPDSADSVDYPDFAHLLADAVVQASGDSVGVLICGTGIGMSMSANRHAGVRAALCTDSYMARMARAHNNANVLCLGARVVGEGLAADILQAFLQTPFEAGRHQARVAKIDIKSA
jgi:ribose 5-phosphate isomerase B